MIKPTVGRKIWFIPGDTDTQDYQYELLQDNDYPDKSQPLDATVVGVRSDGTVNLFVLDSGGNAFAHVSVPIYAEGEDIPEDTSYAMWMPYQVSAAAKDNTSVQPATGTVA